MMPSAHFAATQAAKATVGLIGACLTIRFGLGLLDALQFLLGH